ncbi:unnamed protein product [Paramecium primaurelia]|uniref:Uncharacterized protein n=1 Tax=Paramecium primaurelia TaxID=5886 RepID=A0A8S1N798_PARPR|nr:unnamed protein product [Paramecium primaurelia]
MQQSDQAKNILQNESQNQQNNVNPASQLQIQPLPLTHEEALAILPPLPDNMNIVHTLYNQSPNCKCCGGRYYEESVIDIPVLGKLSWKMDFTMPSYCCIGKGKHLLQSLLNVFPQRSILLNKVKDQPRCCCCNNDHVFQSTKYFLENELINFELTDYGRLYIQGVLVLEFQQCYKSIHDILFASEDSTMPQMMVYQPNHRQNNKIRFKAEKNNCPEHPYSLSGWCSICDCRKLERKFEISGLSQGDCQIINTRTKKQACYKTCGCKDVCSCDSCRYADYPNYQITFNNVTKLEKLAIIMCLIHFMIYNEWEFTNYKGIQLSSQIERAHRLAVQQQKDSCCSIF